MKHLLAISVGPVQDFIFAARRTRDLWYGSWILSEVSKAAAQSLAPFGATPIFPPDPFAAEPISNVILIELSGNPKEAASEAKKAATNRWLQETTKAIRGYERYVDNEIWKAQSVDVVEFYAAWVELTDYRASRREVMRMLAARKNLRDFLPSPIRRMGIPKSSLDGGRESAWRQDLLKELDQDRKLRLNRGEQLDVVGITKRLAHWRPYASVSRVAADPWLRGLKPEDRRQLIAACRSFDDTVLMPCDWPQFRETFPFDGTVIYIGRHKEYRSANAQATSRVAEILRPLSKPNPYYALMVADGDRMGKLISEIANSADHRDLSAQLAKFSIRAQEIAEHHFGVHVFSGGDDVLLFVPVDQVAQCASALKDDFDNALKPVVRKYPVLSSPDRQPSLSIGVAIAHFMEPLEDVLRWAREAEKHAKTGVHAGSAPAPERNALAIHLHTRGGSPITYRRQWTENPANRLLDFAQGYLTAILPDRAAFALREMSLHLRGWSDQSACAVAMRREVSLLLDRKRGESRRDIIDSIERDVSRLDAPHDLNLLTDELLIARHIAGVMRQSERAA